MAGSQGSLPALDGLRAVAAFAVLTTHVGFDAGLPTGTGLAGAITSRLDLGVAIFFALSGFLLYRPFVASALTDKPTPDVRRYLLRRAARILPAYWVAAIAVLVVFNRQWLHTPLDWAIPLGLTHIYFPLRLPLGLEQTWSLATEAVFYVLLPVFAFVLGRLARGAGPATRARAQLAGLAVLALGGYVWSALIHAAPFAPATLSGMWLPGYLPWFCAGMALAVIAEWARTDDRPAEWLGTIAAVPGTCLLIAGGAFVVACTPLAGGKTVLESTRPWEALAKTLLYTVIAAMLLVPLITATPHPRTRLILANPVSRFLGRISYGIFLWHLPVLRGYLAVTETPSFRAPFLLTMAVVSGVTVALATVTYYAIEQPVSRWVGRYRARTHHHPLCLPNTIPEPAGQPGR
ncbi:acyltransferase family protein [Actinokineospora sp.]|uniref:acyltransferase family protein n=1 Tax=Actinokineospora sp. TaxID=1872133 RepID=UPI004037DC2A